LRDGFSTLPMTRKAILRSFFDTGNSCEHRRCILMTGDAIVHRPRTRLFHHIHLLDIAVALLARDVLVHVHTVIEVRIIRHFVDPFPRHQLSFIIVLCHADDVGSGLAGDRVAVHAGAEGRNHGVSRFGGTGVTVLTVHSHLTCMQFVRIRYRLDRFVSDAVPFSTGNVECEC